ncbi:DUF2004 domain-containing protein [Listeria monocytogenes]|jgi:hypothetical protein|uniref:Lmo0440 protein n=3 Tax=Listeria monocytogenes TaxID=1639 RepID=Q8Y9T3_LISMO|nr:DUF2004 domain-containing protein [Listeria monocytogenes]NP_463969.1 hypothetical protein lmo0440 [Listeria monocytogenes EGD-e]EAA0164351.1 DUF2004 domain-containing protein [Listeria monocytogenes serotype 1/2a]EAD3236616.1 DUF2004 domain-containing protein [Listeria monocytogenes CFSAN002202]EAE3702272.1 DUF2004 domain-containing protein [Listeria monocytogenes serotype 1/2c]EAF4501891.1 DUF2004 domain-containing protein [Listeria monocytogenes serotype 4b]EAG6254808.1 DUF2004 domain-c
MTNRTLTTKLLGTLSYTQENGTMMDAVIPLDGKEVKVDYSIFEKLTSEDYFKDIVTLTDQIPELHLKAKKTILEQFDGNDTLTIYFDFHTDELPKEVLEVTECDALENVTKEILIDKLVLSGVWFSENANNELDLTFDFKLLPEVSDELLVVRFNTNGEITELTHES